MFRNSPITSFRSKKKSNETRESLTSSVEHLVAVLAGQGEGTRHIAEEFHDLRHVIVVLVVLGSGLGVEEVVSSQ